MLKEDDIYLKHKLLFSSFVGSMVEIVIQNGDNLIPMSGMLLDIDSKFLYIGKNLEEISVAIVMDKVIMIAYEGELAFLKNEDDGEEMEEEPQGMIN